MTPLNREKAARKLCALRGLHPDEDVERIYEVLQAINKTMEGE